MPFQSFETATIEVGGTASKIVIVNASPLIRLGIASALRIQASLAGQTIHHGAKLVDVEGSLLAGSGGVLVCDVAAWTDLDKDPTGLREKVKERGFAICLVGHTDEGAHRLLQLRGISGVVSPDCEAGDLEQAVSEVGQGKTWFKSELRQGPTTGISKLSCRQVEILELMTRGLLNKQIAWELGVTEGTVKSHVSAILEKLGCDRRTQAITAFLQSMGVGHQAPQHVLHS